MAKVLKGLEERRQEIVAAARRLFQAEDYDKITMQDVVDELGIAKGTIYYYFNCKEDLLKAVVENIVEEDIERKQMLIKTTHGNALEKIRALIESDSMAVKNPALLEHLHKPSNAGMHIQLLAVTIMQEVPLYGKLIRQGCNEGIFQTDTPLECAEFIISGIQFLTDKGIYPWSEADLLRRAQAFPALVEAVLKAPEGSFQFTVDKV